MGESARAQNARSWSASDASEVKEHASLVITALNFKSFMRISAKDNEVQTWSRFFSISIVGYVDSMYRVSIPVIKYIFVAKVLVRETA